MTKLKYQCNFFNYLDCDGVQVVSKLALGYTSSNPAGVFNSSVILVFKRTKINKKMRGWPFKKTSIILI